MATVARDGPASGQRDLDWRARGTIVFVDEVHRFNKAQQDAFLPHIESGLFTFIGATTENPSFEVNSALLSRAQVYVLRALADDDLKALAARTQQQALSHLSFDDAAIALLVGYADGDARRLLNLMEQTDTAARAAKVWAIDSAFLQQALTVNARRFDKGGDHFYDQISALHKSVRGSSPDAALYWLCRMLDGGADIQYSAAARGAHGVGRHRPGRSARDADRKRSSGHLRTAGLARRRIGACASGAVPGGRAQEQRGLQGVQRRACIHPRRPFARGAAALCAMRRRG